MSTPTAAERRTALCSVRGALQVLHNAANLVKLVDVDAERMLRTSEGLVRSSVTRVEFVNRTSVAANSPAEAKEKVEPCQGVRRLLPHHRVGGRKSKKKKEAAAVMDVHGNNGRWWRGTSLGRWC